MIITTRGSKVMVEPDNKPGDIVGEGKIATLHGGILARIVDLHKVEDMSIMDTKLAVRIQGKYSALFHKQDCDNEDDFCEKCIKIIDYWCELA